MRGACWVRFTGWLFRELVWTSHADKLRGLLLTPLLLRRGSDSARWQIYPLHPTSPSRLSLHFRDTDFASLFDYKSLHGFFHAHLRDITETESETVKGFFSLFNSICSLLLRTGNLCLSHAVFICFFTPSPILNLILLCLFTKQRDKSPVKAEPLLDFPFFICSSPSLRLREYSK